MRKSALALAAVVALLFAAPAVASITYVSSPTAVGSSGSYTLSITTDGTIGALTGAQITDWTILLSDSHGSITLTPLNSQLGFAGSPSSLSATATDLFFNYDGFGYLAFQNPNLGSGQNFICFAAATTCGTSNHSVSLLVGSDVFAISSTPKSGNLLIASVSSAVPEPAAWAMMLLGFAAIGLTIRQQKRMLRHA